MYNHGGTCTVIVHTVVECQALSKNALRGVHFHAIPPDPPATMTDLYINLSNLKINPVIYLIIMAFVFLPYSLRAANDHRKCWQDKCIICYASY